MPEIQAVVLDYGEVLCRAPHPEEWGVMAGWLGMESAEFLRRYAAVRLPYDQGVVEPEEYWRQVAGPERQMVNGNLERLRRMDVEIYSRLDPVMVGWIPKLRAAGYRVGLLSNMPHDMAAYARAEFRWLGELDGCVLSCEHRLVKPMPEIYRLTCEQMGVAPEETLFVDDRAVNVEAAEAGGLQAVQFQTVEQLRAESARLGLRTRP
jgi:putative hydrolase of the HAD superfamily